jgi:hypothetical protein
VAVALQLGALVAFVIENHLQVEELTWSVSLWVCGGALAVVAGVLAFVTQPRGSGALPALLAVGLMPVLPLIFLSMLAGG